MQAAACCLAAVLLSTCASNAAASSDQDGALVAEWLHKIGLPPSASAEYAERVREEAVDVAMFGELLDDSEGLRALGVSNALHRARIVARWRERPAATGPFSSPKDLHQGNDEVDAQPAPIPQLFERDLAMDAEQGRPDKADREQERLADERAEQERLADERAEQERLADERAEQERLADERAEQERLADDQVEQERLADERAEQERLADERAEQERLADDQVEQERLADERAEQERLADERAEQERLADERAEQERLADDQVEQERLADDQVEQEHLVVEQGDHEPVVPGQAHQRLTVTLHGRSGLYFTTAGNDTVVVTAVHANLPAARAGLATGWRVATVSGKPCKGVLSLQRALVAAEDSENSSTVELELDPPSTITNIDKKARRKLQKRGNAAAKKLRGVCGGRHDVDATSDFYRLASNLDTMADALRIADESEVRTGGRIDLDRPFVLPADHTAGTGRTSLLGHVLSMVTRTLGLLGGVKLGLAPGTARYKSSHLSDSGATEAIALAKWLARRVVNPAQPSAAGYPPVFYAVALREYELMHILVAERAVAVDDGGPNPYLPTPMHVLLQLPDERVQLARELLRRNSASGAGDASPTQELTDAFNHTDAYAPEQFADGLLYSTELRAMFEGVSRGGGAITTLTMGDLALSVHSWQLPFLVLLLAHSENAPALVAQTDAWQRNVAHMAARAGNTRAVSLLPLHEETLLAPDFMGRTPLHAAAMHGYTTTVRVLLDALESFQSQELRTRLQASRDKSGLSFQDLHPRARAPIASADRDRPATSEPYVPTGGWGRTKHAASRGHRANSVGCEIDVRKELSAPEFLMQYLVPGRPVLLRGAALDWGFRHAWSKQRLLEAHGELVLPAGTIPYADVFANNASAAVDSNTLAAFVNHMEKQPAEAGAWQARPPPYVFFDGIGQVAPDLLDSFPTVPPFLDFASEKMVDRTPSAVQWYIGPAGSGAPMHFHGDAWNALAHGRKRWLLLPPAEALYSAQPISTWIEGAFKQFEDAAGSRPLECVQEAGDVLYVPCDWGHGVLNLQTSVGVATEFSWGHGQRG